ncbi:thymidine phosphorylase family protein [Ferruginibacter profundus]
MQHTKHSLLFRDLGIDTNQELVVFMPASCHVCKSEGFQALTRLSVSLNGVTIIAALNIINDGLLKEGEISLSKSAVQKLNVQDNDLLQVDHTKPLQSMRNVRAKLYGNRLNQDEYDNIIQDIADEKYSNIFLSTFVAACSGTNMKLEEICYLTKAMIKAGNKLEWKNEIIADKHCVGGLPGNRTTMIVVPIIASLGIMIPKTSSRAITSPAGTADTMEVLTNVNLSLAQMRKVVEKENGCIVWGGAMKLSPADDIIIKVEKALDIDSEGQMIASILSKKAAAGATHCIIDIPVGATAKVRTVDDAISLTLRLKRVADYIGLNIQTICTNGEQPVGHGIGPSLEARDVLAVLQNAAAAPKDLRKRAVTIAAEIVKLVWHMEEQAAEDLVIKKIDGGEAFSKLISICEAQGGFNEPKEAKYCRIIESSCSGIITEIDNRSIARVAKLSGAPDAKEAGIDFIVRLNQQIIKGQPLFTILANSPGELEYAYEYYKQNEKQIIKLSYE